MSMKTLGFEISTRHTFAIFLALRNSPNVDGVATGADPVVTGLLAVARHGRFAGGWKQDGTG
jgi:hypothetical protein